MPTSPRFFPTSPKILADVAQILVDVAKILGSIAKILGAVGSIFANVDAGSYESRPDAGEIPALLCLTRVFGPLRSLRLRFLLREPVRLRFRRLRAVPNEQIFFCVLDVLDGDAITYFSTTDNSLPSARRE